MIFSRPVRKVLRGVPRAVGTMGDEAGDPGGTVQLARREMVVLLVDVVESVLLMERDEDDAVRRWLEFLQRGEALVARHGGRLRKKTGDGMIVEMPDAPDAVRCALALSAEKARENEGAQQTILIRCVVDRVEVIDAGDDVYGRDINRAIRLLSLAQAGATIVSAAVRDELIDSIDASFEDLGERFVRHVPEPQRVYRVEPARIAPTPARPVDNTEPMIGIDALMPTLAFVPPVTEPGLHWLGLGEILAEQVIGQLASSRELRVISRLSTSALANRRLDGARIGRHLNADYVVTGDVASDGTREGIVLSLELSDLRDGAIGWHEELRMQASEIVARQGGFVSDLAARIAREVRRREVDLVRSRPLQSLQHHTLMMGAVTLMHRLSYHEFMRAETALNTLVERAGRQALPLAWLAKWHALRVQQGWSPDPARDAAAGQEATNRALDADPDCTLALVMDGLVKTNLTRRHDEAVESYDRALDLCPNDPLGWLLRGTLHAFRGNGAEAVAFTDRALSLTPLDPHRFYYTSLAATANLAAGNYERVLELGQESLRLNRTHTSTIRAIGVAHARMGHETEARAMGDLLRKLEPDLTVGHWLSVNPAGSYPIGAEWADDLRAMGVPA